MRIILESLPRISSVVCVIVEPVLIWVNIVREWDASSCSGGIRLRFSSLLPGFASWVCTYHPCLVHLHNGRFSKGDLHRILDAKIDLRY